MFSGKQLDKWEGSFFILWCNHLTENFTGGSSTQEEQKQYQAILDVSHKVIGVSLFAHTDTHLQKQHTHTHTDTNTHTPWHTHRSKRGNSRSMSWTILDISWYIFTTHFPSLWQLPHGFHYQGGLLLHMNEERCTHTLTHVCARKEREGEESCFATRKRKVHVSLILLWCNTSTLSEHTHTHSP